jgi:DNA polymerase-3 subunit gamma/tau
MSHIALARKWRPQRFEDVIGQRGVVETLKNAITSGRLAQAFIFAGPRGVGKTTTARILARALNCVHGPTPEPCGQCDACIEIAEGRDVDVFEIDGATYTGVDAVREVIVEPLGIAPMRDRFKVFIIDEVHRLSKSAFDALLKSIEEPPPYVKFMMATTELQSVPATIQSRSQVFELKTLPFTAIREQLKRVTSNEQVLVDDGALTLVARSAEGSMRDALSALDQVLAFTTDRVSTSDVSVVLGLIGRDLQFQIVETVAREDVADVFALAGSIVEAGFDLRIVCRELARLMRDLMVVKIDPSRLGDPEIAGEGEREALRALAAQFSREDLIRSFDLLSRTEYDIKGSSQPRHHLEMALVKWIHLRNLTPLAELIAGLEGGQAPGSRPQAQTPKPLAPRPDPQASSSKPQAPGNRLPASDARPQAITPEPRNLGTPGLRNPGTSEPRDLKSALLSAIRERNKVFYSMVVAQAKSVEVEPAGIVFTFAPVHKSLRAEFERQRPLIEELAQAAAGRKLNVITREGQLSAAVAGSEPDPAAQRKADLTARAKAEPSVQAVLDVFGGDIEDVEEIK